MSSLFHALRPILMPVSLALALLPAPAACAEALPEPIAQALAKAGLPDSHIGLVVQDLGRDTPELAFGGQRPLNPASVMKVVTTLAALDRLGPAHIFKTQVLVSGNLTDGVLDGDLVLRGGGDPSLTRERFWLLLRAIRERGVRTIRGDVVIDNGLYAIDAVDPAAFDAAPLKPHNAAPAALLVNYNVHALRLRPAGAGVEAMLDPAALTLDSQLASVGEPPCNGWQEGLAIERAGDRLRLAGRYPVACGERTVWLNLMCPPATAAAYFDALWAESGGRHDGRFRLGSGPADARLLLEFDSEPLARIVRDTNKFSNNVMAKMLYLDLGVAAFGAPASWDKGERAIRQWLQERGLEVPELVLENGSGLSRNERISAAALARLLLWAARQPLYYEFAASLPALGLEGTQKRRMNGAPEAGRAWLKTGSLNGARSLAGYVLDAAGRRKVVVLFINHAEAARTDEVQAAVLRWAMAGEPVLP